MYNLATCVQDAEVLIILENNYFKDFVLRIPFKIKIGGGVGIGEGEVYTCVK
jgi:hypothetical protein